MTETLHVTGMTCGGCENAVKSAVRKLKGIESVDASAPQQRVTVTFDPAQVDLEAVKTKITALGYRVEQS